MQFYPSISYDNCKIILAFSSYLDENPIYAAVFSTFYNFLKEGEEGREIKKIMKETLKQNTQFKRWPQQEFVQLFPVFTNSCSSLFVIVGLSYICISVSSVVEI